MSSLAVTWDAVRPGPMVAVGTRISPRPPDIYGPAARCKRINWMGHAVRFNLSGLWLEHALRAIMEIRAQLSYASTAAGCRRSGGWSRDDPRGACHWPRSIARTTLVFG